VVLVRHLEAWCSDKLRCSRRQHCSAHLKRGVRLTQQLLQRCTCACTRSVPCKAPLRARHHLQQSDHKVLGLAEPAEHAVVLFVITSVTTYVITSLCLHAQAASLGELQQALQVGFPPERIVFDTPAKTRSELRWACSKRTFYSSACNIHAHLSSLRVSAGKSNTMQHVSS
jgi:hypothetical protein